MITLITGGTGNLGKELVKIFPESIHPTHGKLDLRNKSDVTKWITKQKPDIVIHCAAWTDVRGCESNKTKAWENNVEATLNLVDSCQRYANECYLVYMSTACVFRGDKGDYIETDIPYPDNFYSLTKLLGEFIVKKLKNHLIIRANFVPKSKWRYEKAFTDRFGTYLFANDLASAIKTVIERKMIGLVHVAGEEKLSMFELAKITTPNIKPITLQEVDLPLPQDMSLSSVKIESFRISKET